MSYLRYTTEQQAQERSMVEAFRRGCDMVSTKYWWPMLQDGTDYLLNVGDGNGLSIDELARMEDEIQ
jgi:hypothetical protein